jgi:hypothetical protein
MKIIITENQYNKIFLSGKYDNILEEQLTRLIDDLFDSLDFDDMKKLYGSNTYDINYNNFNRDFPADVINKFKTKYSEFNFNTGTYEDFLKELKKINEIDEVGFNILYKFRSAPFKRALETALSKNNEINRIITLYHKAEDVNNIGIMIALKNKLKEFLGDSDVTIENFLKKFKGTGSIDTLTSNVDTLRMIEDIKKWSKSVKNEDEFNKLILQTKNKLDEIYSSGLKLYVDGKYVDFKLLKKTYNDIIGSNGDFSKFKDFIEKNQTKLNEIKKGIDIRNPGFFTKLYGSILKGAKHSKEATFTILLLVIIVIGGVSIYTVKSVMGGDSDAKLIKKLIKKNIDDKTLKINFNGVNESLTEEDIVNNSDLLTQNQIKITEITKDEDNENLLTFNLSLFYFLNDELKNVKFTMDQETSGLLTFVSSDNLKTETQIQKDKNGRNNFFIQKVLNDKSNWVNKDETPTVPPESKLKDYFTWEYDDNKKAYHLIMKSDIEGFIPNTKNDTLIYIKNNGNEWVNRYQTYENNVAELKRFLKNEYGTQFLKKSNKIEILPQGSDEYAIVGLEPEALFFKYKEDYPIIPDKLVLNTFVKK